MRLPGRVWIAIHRAQNRWHDARARLAGYCNDCPIKVSPDDDRGGGYTFWRCALERRHGGMHRARNYVWDDAGHCEYAPVDRPPLQPWDRKPTPTMRQARRDREWKREQLDKLRAARKARRDGR